MTQQPYPNQPMQPPPAPPGGYGAYPPPVPRGPVWPRAIGWVSIALASLYLAMGLWGLVQKPDLSKFRPEAREEIGSWMHTWQPVLTVTGLGTNCLLLAGGICLLKRRRAARPLHLAYGVLAILASFPGAYMTAIIAQGVAMPPGPSAAAAKTIMTISLAVGVVLGLAFAWSYPVFLFIWFGRRKVKADMAAW